MRHRLVVLALAAGACATASGSCATPSAQRRTEGPAVHAGAAPGASPSPSSPGMSSTTASSWSYEVKAAPRGATLAVELVLPVGSASDLGVGEGGGPFVVDVVAESGSRGRRTIRAGDDGVWRVPECHDGCRVTYTFELRKAGVSAHDRGIADARGDVVEAPPSTWLLYPLAAPLGATYRLHVTPAPGEAFASGMFAVAGEADTYEGRLARPFDLPYAAFGPLRREVIAGGHVEVAYLPGTFRDGAAIAAWLARSAEVVTAYYRRPPVERTLVLLRPASGRRVGMGSTMGSSGAAIDIAVGADIEASALRDDWVLVHELIHTALPDLDRQHHWLEEGLATYVEPLARARAGLTTPERVFGEWLDGMPKGQPEPGDEGLDRTPTWGRTYWGGALFCLVADVEIRTRTKGRRSLDDALRGILAAGGNIAVHWPIAALLAAGDEATGVPVLAELFARMAPKPERVDLDALWKQLGVTRRGGKVTFDDSAPLAALRRSLFIP